MSDSLQSLSMGFSRQEYWNGFPFPSPGDLPDPGMEPGSPALQVDPLLSEPPGKLLFILLLLTFYLLLLAPHSFIDPPNEYSHYLQLSI